MIGWVRRLWSGSRGSSRAQEAIQTSDDLLTVKRQMARFSDDLRAGRIHSENKVIRIDSNLLVRKSRSDFLDELLTNREGDRGS